MGNLHTKFNTILKYHFAICARLTIVTCAECLQATASTSTAPPFVAIVNTSGSIIIFPMLLVVYSVSASVFIFIFFIHFILKFLVLYVQNQHTQKNAQYNLPVPSHTSEAFKSKSTFCLAVCIFHVAESSIWVSLWFSQFIFQLYLPYQIFPRLCFMFVICVYTKRSTFPQFFLLRLLLTHSSEERISKISEETKNVVCRAGRLILLLLLLN